jgi:hypothetical protein
MIGLFNYYSYVSIHISGSNAREDSLNDFRNFGPFNLLWKFLKDSGKYGYVQLQNLAVDTRNLASRRNFFPFPRSNSAGRVTRITSVLPTTHKLFGQTPQKARFY